MPRAVDPPALPVQAAVQAHPLALGDHAVRFGAVLGPADASLAADQAAAFAPAQRAILDPVIDPVGLVALALVDPGRVGRGWA